MSSSSVLNLYKTICEERGGLDLYKNNCESQKKPRISVFSVGHNLLKLHPNVSQELKESIYLTEFSEIEKYIDTNISSLITNKSTSKMYCVYQFIIDIIQTGHNTHLREEYFKIIKLLTEKSIKYDVNNSKKLFGKVLHNPIWYDNPHIMKIYKYLLSFNPVDSGLFLTRDKKKSIKLYALHNVPIGIKSLDFIGLLVKHGFDINYIQENDWSNFEDTMSYEYIKNNYDTIISKTVNNIDEDDSIDLFGEYENNNRNDLPKILKYLFYLGADPYIVLPDTKKTIYETIMDSTNKNYKKEIFDEEIKKRNGYIKYQLSESIGHILYPPLINIISNYV